MKNKKKRIKVSGRVLKNDFEEKIYNSLCSKLGKHRIDYESVKLPYTLEFEYIPDFTVLTANGSHIFIETKGNGRSFDNQVRRKMIAVRDQHPHLNIKILFYSDGKIGPKRRDGSFMRQSDWATKNKFEFAIKEIPDEWLV